MTKAREVASTPETVLASGTINAGTTSLSLSNVLSDTYKFYSLNLYFTTTSDFSCNLRFRENTTDVTTSYLTSGVQGYFAGGTAAYYPTTSRANLVISAGNAALSTSNIVITRPDATQGFMSGHAVDRSNNSVAATGGYRTGMTNFNGITIFPNGGTFSGYYILTGRRA